jgi:hypothetical protein
MKGFEWRECLPVNELKIAQSAPRVTIGVSPPIPVAGDRINLAIISIKPLSLG